MGELSEARLGAVRRIIELAPDRAVRGLEMALAHGARGDKSLGLVQDMVSAEMLDRRVRSAVLAPLMPLCMAPLHDLPRLSFPYSAPSLTWRGLKQADPQTAGQALRTGMHLRGDEEFPPVFDELAARAATGLRIGEDAFQPLRELLLARGSETLEQYTRAVELVPLARRAMRRLPTWVRTLSGEYAASIRLAFRDAVEVNEDAGPVFLEILFGQLEEPYQILRLISLVMEKPGDRYLASSELASFGERLLADLERRVEEVRRFDSSRGLEGGVALAGAVMTSTSIINEFEQWLEIKKEGPWGSRLAGLRRTLASSVEARLKEAETAVATALPTSGMRGHRGPAKLDADPDPAAVVRAQALLAFLNESRASAAYGGFGAVRTKVVEALDARIDQYAEELLELLHAGAQPAERLREYLALAAEFLGLVRDPKAADIVRRRTAVA